MHEPAGGRVEGVALVHGATIVPADKVALLPDLSPGEALLGDLGPELVEDGRAFVGRKTDDRGVPPPAEEQAGAAALAMAADDRMVDAGPGAHVVAVGDAHAEADVAAAVINGLV